MFRIVLDWQITTQLSGEYKKKDASIVTGNPGGFETKFNWNWVSGYNRK